VLDYKGEMGLQLISGKCEVICHPDTVINDPYQISNNDISDI